MNIANNVLDLIGNTPLVQINKLNKHGIARVVAKLEAFNPGSSVKDRPALKMIEKAEQEEVIKPHESIIIEPTSGNTGIGLAMVCSIKNYRLILTMPENMSIERRKILKALGAEIVLTSAELGMKGAVNKAQELAQNTPNSFVPSQFNNSTNCLAHFETTAEEIWRDTDGKVDMVIAGIGTGGTITGLAKKLKEKNPEIKIIGVEPAESPFLTQGCSGMHKIQGIGAGFKPDILDKDLIDEIHCVSSHDAIETAKKLIKKEGLLSGISCGAAMNKALEFSKKEENKDKLIIAILPDTAERYLSTSLFE